MSFYTYMYMYGETYLYIGLADASNTPGQLGNRISAHAKEQRFKPYLDGCNIYYCCWESAGIMKFMEQALIRRYKPQLNVVYNQHDAVPIDFHINWIPYNKQSFHTEPNIKKQIAHKPSEKRMFIQMVTESIRNYLYDNEETYVRVDAYFERKEQSNTHSWVWSTQKPRKSNEFDLVSAKDLDTMYICPSCGKDTRKLQIRHIKKYVEPSYCYMCGHRFKEVKTQ